MSMPHPEETVSAETEGFLGKLVLLELVSKDRSFTSGKERDVWWEDGQLVCRAL